MVDELLDLVDDTNAVIGTILRGDAYKQNQRHIRLVYGFQVNSKGELWIPRRHTSKKLFPNCLEVSIGGHVKSGETYEQAFVRELAEELRIDAATVDWREKGLVTPIREDTSAFIKVFEFHSDKVPDYNRDDFSDYIWRTPTALRAEMATDPLHIENLPKVLNALYS